MAETTTNVTTPEETTATTQAETTVTTPAETTVTTPEKTTVTTPEETTKKTDITTTITTTEEASIEEDTTVTDTETTEVSTETTTTLQTTSTIEEITITGTLTITKAIGLLENELTSTENESTSTENESTSTVNESTSTVNESTSTVNELTSTVNELTSTESELTSTETETTTTEAPTTSSIHITTAKLTPTTTYTTQHTTTSISTKAQTTTRLPTTSKVTTHAPITSTEAVTATTSSTQQTTNTEVTEYQTTTIAPVTLLPTLPPENVMYAVSSDGYFSDLSCNSTPSGGMPVEIVEGPFGFGAAIKLEEDDENCLHRTNFSGGTPKASCFNDMSNCNNEGLSISIWVNIAFDTNDQSSKYILSTGGDTDGVPGLAIYYKGVDLHAVVSNGTHYWYVYAPGPVPNNTWSNIGLKWADIDGWEMFVDQERVAKVVYPTPTNGPAKSAISPPEIAVGCHVLGNPLQFRNYSEGKFDEVVIWFHELNDTELTYFSGGYDPQAANMSVEDVAEIVTNKLDLKSLQQHQQAVDILTKMSDSVPESESNDEISTTSTPSVTEATTDSQIAQNTTNNTSTLMSDYVVSDQDQSPTNDAEQNIQKLYTISQILLDMIKPSCIKPNMTLQELSAFQDTLKVFSNVLDVNNKEKWSLIQKDGNYTIAIVQSILQWGIDLTKNTWLKTKSQSFQFTKTTKNIVLTTQRLTVQEYIASQGFVVPNYEDPAWNSVAWREGSTKLPLDGIGLPRDLFTELGRPQNSKLHISNVVFDSADELAPITVNAKHLPSTNMIFDSKILSVLMEPSIGFGYSLYYHNLRVTFAHINKEQQLTRDLLFHDESRRIPTIKSRYCASWNPSVKPNGGWDSRGCTMYHTNEQYSVCDCDHMGIYAILAQNIERRMIYPDPDWLMYLKYAFYILSTVCLIFYILTIIVSRNLKDQFHIIRLCASLAVLSGSVCMFTTDFVRGDRHSCTAVTAVLHYSYVAVACWLLIESHALFGTMMHGIVGGKLKAYFPFAWGCPMLFLGVAILGDFQDYGFEPRCMVSWNDNLKWTMFAPILIFGASALVLTSATILNTSFAAVKKEMVFEDVSSVAWGLLFVTVIFAINWVFACLAYLDIEYMYPDFYPIFQVLNAAMGFLVFIFMGLGSKRFRLVLRGKTPDSRVHCNTEK